MKPRLFIIIIGIQLATVVFLFFQIKEKSGSILGVSVNPIDQKTVNFVPRVGLKYFYEPKPNSTEEVDKDWLSYVPKYTINKDALNERYDYSEEKPLLTYRIITLGASYTFGENVSTGDNWTEILEDELNQKYTCKKVKKYEVINLGMNGYDIQYEVERYRIRGQKYNPDVVIWYITDLKLITEKIIELSNNMHINEKDYEKNGIFFETWNLARSKAISLYGEKDMLEFQISQIEKFRKEYFRKNSLLFLSPFKKEIEEALGHDAIYYNDEESQVRLDKKYLLPDSHFNKEGNREFAKVVIRAMTMNGLLPCVSK